MAGTKGGRAGQSEAKNVVPTTSKKKKIQGKKKRRTAANRSLESPRDRSMLKSEEKVVMKV